MSAVLALDVADYQRMPPDVRQAFDDWLAVEGLSDELVFRVEWPVIPNDVADEPTQITTHRYVRNRDTGRVYVGPDRQPATARITHRVRSTPPHVIAPYLVRSTAA